jgi:hypothetical protein
VQKRRKIKKTNIESDGNGNPVNPVDVLGISIKGVPADFPVELKKRPKAHGFYQSSIFHHPFKERCFRQSNTV